MKKMSTVKLVDENTNNPKVRAVFEDIKGTKKIDRVPNIWRALATHPEHLELCWSRLKAIMRPGKIDLLTKEIIALALDQRGIDRLFALGFRQIGGQHHWTGKNAVDSHLRISAAEFHSQAARQRRDRALGGEIGGIIQIRPGHGPVADVDNTSAFA